MTEKQDAWAKEYEKYRHTVDKLGKPIDEGIFETVVALNILGVHTQSSCEGHLDHGHAYPWIAIASPDGMLLEKRASEKLHEAQQSPDQYRSLMAEADSIANTCKRRHQVYVPALFNYLDRFYQVRQIVYDRHLVLDNRLWTGRLCSWHDHVIGITYEDGQWQLWRWYPFQKEAHIVDMLLSPSIRRATMILQDEERSLWFWCVEEYENGVRVTQRMCDTFQEKKSL